MVKRGKTFICSSCSYESIKWLGKCSQCSAWNSFTELNREEEQGGEYSSPLSIMEIMDEDLIRYSSYSKELDGVLGGGIVSGSVILLGGDPGIGKSTFLLQVSAFLANGTGKVLYISGEESKGQIRLRARRLGALVQRLYILALTDLKEIIHTIGAMAPILVVVDSIQSIHDKEIPSLPGSIRQVQGVASHLVQLAKGQGISLVLIGHVTKGGLLAGPKVLEHLVDTVLYLEGEDQGSYRILRGIKNRYGATNGLGLFSMTPTGLMDVSNPSSLFIHERPIGVSGSIIVPCLEGSRSFLVEVQALVTQASFGTPCRITSGVDQRRLILLIAVLEKHLGLILGDQDVHVNIPGGLKVNDVAIHLGIMMAIISSYRDEPLPPKMAVLGEVGLAGEVRTVMHVERRITEAMKLGFTQILLPKDQENQAHLEEGVELIGINHISAIHELVRVG